MIDYTKKRIHVNKTEYQIIEGLKWYEFGNSHQTPYHLNSIGVGGILFRPTHNYSDRHHTIMVCHMVKRDSETHYDVDYYEIKLPEKVFKSIFKFHSISMMKELFDMIDFYNL